MTRIIEIQRRIDLHEEAIKKARQELLQEIGTVFSGCVSPMAESDTQTGLCVTGNTQSAPDFLRRAADLQQLEELGAIVKRRLAEFKEGGK